MPKALIVYSSRSGQTKLIGELVAEGLRMTGIEVNMLDAKKIKDESELEGYDILVFGSATYHGEMMNSMKTFLFLAEKADLAGKVGGSFGAFGWSGEAPERIYYTMKNIYNLDMVNGPLMLKSSTLGGGINMAQEYGRQIAGKLS